VGDRLLNAKIQHFLPYDNIIGEVEEYLCFAKEYSFFSLNTPYLPLQFPPDSNQVSTTSSMHLMVEDMQCSSWIIFPFFRLHFSYHKKP
jgi:hypothetical protein